MCIRDSSYIKQQITLFIKLISQIIVYKSDEKVLFLQSILIIEEDSPRSCVTPPPLKPPRSWEMIQAGMIDQTQVK